MNIKEAIDSILPETNTANLHILYKLNEKIRFTYYFNKTEDSIDGVLYIGINGVIVVILDDMCVVRQFAGGKVRRDNLNTQWISYYDDLKDAISRSVTMIHRLHLSKRNNIGQ